MSTEQEGKVRQVILYRGEDGYWVAECRSLPGCVSQGENRAQAVANIREAIEGYEAALKSVESEPGFVKMMKQTEADIRAGRVLTQAEVERRLRRKRKRR
jgi:predicted RNase H-like HicB family nuclease